MNSVTQRLKELQNEIEEMRYEYRIPLKQIAIQTGNTIGAISQLRTRLWKLNTKVKMSSLVSYIYAIASHPDNKSGWELIHGFQFRKFMNHEKTYLQIKMLPKEYTKDGLVELPVYARTIEDMITLRRNNIPMEKVIEAITPDNTSKYNAREYETRWMKFPFSMSFESLYKYAELTHTHIVNYRVDDVLELLKEKKEKTHGSSK